VAGHSGSISGRVLFPDGSDAVRVRVRITPAGKPADRNTETAPLKFVETTASGEYRIEDLPVGSFFVAAGSVVTPTYFPSGTDASKAKPVKVSAGTETRNIHLRLEGISSGFDIRGRAVFESGVRPAQLPVVMVQEKLRGSGIAPDGSFRIFNLRPGTYTLSAFGATSAKLRPVTVTIIDKDVNDVELFFPLIAPPK
jgi:hypothetical protein